MEHLALGIHGKLCLWKALKAASKFDSRLHEYDFENSSAVLSGSTKRWRARGSDSLKLLSRPKRNRDTEKETHCDLTGCTKRIYLLLSGGWKRRASESRFVMQCQFVENGRDILVPWIDQDRKQIRTRITCRLSDIGLISNSSIIDGDSSPDPESRETRNPSVLSF